MTAELVWANVMRPRTPLVYLDLNTIINIARCRAGHSKALPDYANLYEAALRAKADKRARFPLGEAHLWEISKIKDPRQRGRLADILEKLSDYNYLMGRIVIAELEFEAGIAKIMGEDISDRCYPLLRPTVGQVFGMKGGIEVLNRDGSDGSDAVRAQMPDLEFADLIAIMNYQFERLVLRGPSDEDLVELRKDPNFKPEVALSSHQSRVGWELDTAAHLNMDPKWRRGRLRDIVGAREIVHEWIDLLTRIRVDRINSGLPPFDPSEEDFRSFFGSLPHTQVAVSIKTRYHRNPKHNWTRNDISDIDAVSVAYAYCEAVFPDKAVRNALINAKELRVIPTFLPRRPAELTEWLDALPPVVGPDLLVPHPLFT